MKILVSPNGPELEFVNVGWEFGKPFKDRFSDYEKTIKEHIKGKEYFTNPSKKTGAIKIKPKYKTLIEELHLKYADSLEEKLGIFLLRKKIEGDDFYKRFLLHSENKDTKTIECVGDQEYREIKLDGGAPILQSQGIYMFCIGDKIMYIGKCEKGADGENCFYKRIINGYGRISPKNCINGGQSTNCRINPKLAAHADNIKLWISCVKDEEISDIEKNLIDFWNPPWNIQGKKKIKSSPK
jgi:hypothetical protein